MNPGNIFLELGVKVSFFGVGGGKRIGSSSSSPGIHVGSKEGRQIRKYSNWRTDLLNLMLLSE